MDLLCINFMWNIENPVIGQLQLLLFWRELIWKVDSFYDLASFSVLCCGFF